MKRPEIKDKDVLKYVEYLEGELREYDIDSTISGFLKASKKQIDDISDVMESITLDVESIMGSNGKLFDRVVKLLEKAPAFMNTMLDARKHIKDIYKSESGDKSVDPAGRLEKYISKT